MWVSLSWLGLSMFILSAMLFTLSFCPLFTLLFIWQILSLGFVVMLFCCVSLVWVPFWVFSNCSLWVYVWFIGVCFSICFKMSSEGSVPRCLSYWSWGYCSAVICVGFTCLLFLVISHPVFIWIWCMVCHCGYGLPFLLLYNGSMVHHLLIALPQ